MFRLPDHQMTPFRFLAERVDTVLMNPPFGTRRAGIDVIFLERALEVSEHCSSFTTLYYHEGCLDYTTRSFEALKVFWLLSLGG